MRIALFAAAMLVLAVACSSAKHSGTGTPYSTGDLAWLTQVARWNEQYATQSETIDSTYRDVEVGIREPNALRDALRPLSECTQNVRRDVGEPRSERLRQAYDLLLDSCEEDRKAALALVEAAVTATDEKQAAAYEHTARSQRLYDRAYKLIEGGLRANRRLPVRGGVTAVSRIEPRLSRVAGKLALQRVEVRCWSVGDWRLMLREWNAYAGDTRDLAGFVDGVMRVYIAPEYCASLARFVYRRWRPVTSDGLEDVANAVEILAHESGHLLSTLASEDKVECQAVQDVDRLAQLLGASKAVLSSARRHLLGAALSIAIERVPNQGVPERRVVRRRARDERFSLAADLAHRPARSHEARLVDPVLQLLVPDSEADQGGELVVGRAVAERGFQVPLAAREQARAQLAVGGEPDPVAARAERFRHRVHEADLARAVGEAEAARSRRRLCRYLLERPALLDQGADLAAGQHFVLAPDFVRVERHELDEADDVRLAARELGERRNLLFGEPTDSDTVDLDRTELRIALCLREAGEDAVERVATCDFREPDV